MIKTTVADQIWLVEQPDHARVAGLLAAHWGNDTFQRPGSFESPRDPPFWREQVIFAVTEHDNGWIEWEEQPELDAADGLPLHFLDVGLECSFRNWRTGIARFAETHPFPALLISWHARLLLQCLLAEEMEPQHVPPLLAGAHVSVSTAGQEHAKRFVVEQLEFESALMERASAEAAVKIADDEGIENPLMAFPKRGIPPDVPVRQEAFLMPHVRLLQILDSLSIALCCGGGEKKWAIQEAPRSGWADRVAIQVIRGESRRLYLDPYPFDAAPLEVPVPVRMLPTGTGVHSGRPGWREQSSKEAIHFVFDR